MQPPRSPVAALGAALLIAALLPGQGPPRLLGWNDLGMHCMDGDMSVFSILPPYNTIRAQLVVGGHLVTTGNYTVTYEAVADPTGSINRSSIGKTDFWQHVQALFGVSLPLDQGLAGFRMPGAANTPQAMAFHASKPDWSAEGIPMTPIDDNGAMRPYPLLRLVARNAQGTAVASTDIVVPVSAEMACVSCHGSGNNPAARPPSGWVYGSSATDDRLNILKLHDERHLGNTIYADSLAAVGYSANGLLDTAVNQQTPVLCARCHGSNALSAPGQPGVPTMTTAMHRRHADARLADGRRLEDVPDRASCYTCHPGTATRCLRGAMGKAIGADGNAMMSCNDCHGSMSAVGDPARTGWLEEPNCQSCHSGDAVQNEGQIRFTNVFATPGHPRVPQNQLFGTTPDAPQAPFSLYRFSTGHGGLECSACHGSPHAIWPSTEVNDNLQSIAAQGHKGTLVECSACHNNLQDTQLVGPHGMHPTGAFWVGKHQDEAQNQGLAACQACHGSDSRGTVLSRAQGDRTLTTQFGTKSFWRGYQVGCFDCHNGPTNDHASTNTPPTVTNRSLATPTDTPLVVTLTATDPNPNSLTLRIVEQPQHGAVAFDGTHATYRARDGFVGTDTFTYAAADGSSNSNLGTVTIAVGAAACAGSSEVFGYGCVGTGGAVPRIALDGCPTGGNTVTVRVDAVPTPFTILGFGTGRGPLEIGTDGCVLRMSSVLTTTGVLPFAAGQASLPIAVPALLGAFDVTLQAFTLDGAQPRGFVASPGLAVRFR